MQSLLTLEHLSDDELLHRLGELVSHSRRVEADLVAHIGEVERRRLYAREASPSMFAYCRERLHLSEAEAYMRIRVARATRRHPVLLDMLRDGRLHLSGIVRLLAVLTRDNRDALLARATHVSKREILELVAELRPRPDVAARMRKLPQPVLVPAAADDRPAPPVPVTGSGSTPRPVVGGAVGKPRQTGDDAGRQLDADGQLCPGTVDATAAPATIGLVPLLQIALAPGPQSGPQSLGTQSLGTQSPDSQPCAAYSASQVDASGTRRRAVVEPLSPGRYKVQFTASAELRGKLERLRALMSSQVPDGDLAAVIDAAVSEKLARLEARRFATTSAPRKGLSDTDTVPASRRVPAAVRRAVRERDGSRCGFVDAQGRRCSEKHRLEFHHRHPFGMGGDHSTGNVALLCRAHNQLVARIDYGPGATTQRAMHQTRKSQEGTTSQGQ